jgi:hypothetical protein
LRHSITPVYILSDTGSATAPSRTSGVWTVHCTPNAYTIGLLQRSTSSGSEPDYSHLGYGITKITFSRNRSTHNH